MIKNILWILVGIAGCYLFFCGLIYFLQEKIIFFPQKLPSDHKFLFDQEFEEINIKTPDNVNLHGILFRADQSRGLIFYLHGNAGSLDSWGMVAGDYLDMGYNLFMLDYRGYGKSEGNISSEKQFMSDVQLAYDYLKTRYKENEIVVLGYSLGTAPASMLAANNTPRLLILQAPYYSFVDMKEKHYPILPTNLLKYRFDTSSFLDQVSAPVAIFHGTNDEVIYYGSSLKLERHLKPGDELITLQNQGHNDMSGDPIYLENIQRLLKVK
ncbi:MAG: alpha/beta hydrolase [Cyclobacteriaceae bacterium]